MSAEHTWPQSLFDGTLDEQLETPTDSYKKADLHALFPSQSAANSEVRVNYPYGEVSEENIIRSSCKHSKRGASEDDIDHVVFEPSQSHKGNVARAMFYFSARYNMKIEKTEEDILRLWHEQDPVDAEEIERMEGIFYFQLTRNPFIDHPEIVDYISNF